MKANVRHGMFLVALSAISLAAAPVASAHVQDPSVRPGGNVAVIGPHGAAVAAARRDVVRPLSDSKAPSVLLNQARVNHVSSSGGYGWVALGALILFAAIAGAAVVLANRGLAGLSPQRDSAPRHLAH